MDTVFQRYDESFLGMLIVTMTLRIRQIVLAARDLDTTVAQLQSVLGVSVCYRDPEVGKFGLHNALFTIGHDSYVQFLEVVSPTQDNTTAGRHLDKHGDSGYMLILQTDDLARERARFKQLGVRMVWEATHEEISAVHLHPKDIGAAIVSVDQAAPPESWRWAGPEWRQHVSRSGAQCVTATTIAATDPQAMSARWSQVLGTAAPKASENAAHIDIQDGALRFIQADKDVLAGFSIRMPNVQTALNAARKLNLPVEGNVVTICGTQFALSER
jgi:hypothetical protein